VATHFCPFAVFFFGDFITLATGIFVDDLLVTGNSKDTFVQVRMLMGEKFQFTDQGRQAYFLGVSFDYAIDEYTVHRLYKQNLGTFQQMTECKLITVISEPLPLNLD
jgi:hypothetical protein